MQLFNRLPGVRSVLLAAGMAVLGIAVAGCPSGVPGNYQAGFDDGFAQDDWYFEGYDDSWFTEGSGPLLYEGGDIPELDDNSYDAGFYDGTWYAYNDGYFVAYQDVFIIGFSEGYDLTFRSQWRAILANDFHVEFDTGGFDDAYNDGFSEGRVFGAFDWEEGLDFNWESAFLDWQELVDVSVTLNDGTVLSTGEDGPVLLYEYGLNPHTLKARTIRDGLVDRSGVALRKPAAKQPEGDIMARPWTEDQLDRIDMAPTNSSRHDREVRLETTWRERILSVTGKKKAEPSSREAALEAR